MFTRPGQRFPSLAEIRNAFSPKKPGSCSSRGRSAKEGPGANKVKNQEQPRTYPSSAREDLIKERIGTHGVDTKPVSTPTTELKNVLEGRQVESHNRPAQERVEASGLGKLNSVMPLLFPL